MRSARRFYRLNLTVGALALVAVGVALGAAIRAIDFNDVTLDAIASACRLVLPDHVGLGDALVLALGSVSIAVAVLAWRGLARHVRSQRRALRRVSVVGGAENRSRARLIRDERPQAFCAGYLRPRVYVSTGAVDALDGNALTAVLAHEYHHARRRDPLRLLVIDVLGDALFFLPIMRRLRRRYRALAELAADEAAVAAVGDRAPLASALLAFSESGQPGLVGVAPERVDHLLGGQPRWELPLSVLTGGLVTVAALVAAAVVAARAAGPGDLSLPLLAAEACMVVMTVAPMVLGASLLLLTKRVVATATR